MDKNSIRKSILQIRNAMASAEITRDSLKIQNKVIKLIEDKNINKIYVYASYGSEVRTDKIINYCIDNSVRVALPRVTNAFESEMDFYEVTNFKTDVEIGYQGIIEPKTNDNAKNAFLPQMIILPGVAFDEYGNRIGYGKGFYDRFLSKIEKNATLVCGLAFDVQVVKKIESDIYDIKADMIMTGSRDIIIYKEEDMNNAQGK